jgi:type II secretory pathway component PulK
MVWQWCYERCRILAAILMVLVLAMAVVMMAMKMVIVQDYTHTNTRTSLSSSSVRHRSMIPLIIALSKAGAYAAKPHRDSQAPT